MISSQNTSSTYIIIIVGLVVGVALLGLLLRRRRVKKPIQTTQLLEVVIEPPSFSMHNPLYGETQSTLMMSSDTTNQNIEINPMFDETLVSPDYCVFEPDKLDNDDDVLQIIEMMICDGCDSFDSIIEQVKGLPIHGKMLMISQTKRDEFIRKIQDKNRAPNEVIDVMSRLRRVKRNSISSSSTVITKMRAHTNWNRFSEKLYLKSIKN